MMKRVCAGIRASSRSASELGIVGLELFGLLEVLERRLGSVGQRVGGADDRRAELGLAGYPIVLHPGLAGDLLGPADLDQAIAALDQGGDRPQEPLAFVTPSLCLRFGRRVRVAGCRGPAGT